MSALDLCDAVSHLTRSIKPAGDLPPCLLAVVLPSDPQAILYDESLLMEQLLPIWQGLQQSFLAR